MINKTKAIKELENRLLIASDTSYDGIDKLMRSIMKKHDVTAKELHYGFKNKHKKTPDDWIKMKQTVVERVIQSLYEDECECEKESKPVMTIKEICKKHNVDAEQIKDQLRMGIKIEAEHTTDKEEAKKIALQHLAERPDYYTKLKKVEESAILNKILEEISLEESGTLHQWFKGSKSRDGKPGWVQADGSPCANEPGETKTPKCFSSSRLESLKSKGKKGKNLIQSAVRRKRKQDPDQQSKTDSSKPTNVKTFAKGKKDKNYVKAEPGLNEATKDIPGKGSGTKDACYHKVKSRYDVWPSAYASASLTKCRKVGAANWGNKSKKSVNEVTLPFQNGHIMQILVLWRGKLLTSQMFFPQIRVPNKAEITDAIVKVYPGSKVINFRLSKQNQGEPLIQVPNSKSKNYLLNNKTIGEDVDYLDEEGPSLSVGRGEKLPVSRGGGLTAKGRARYNRATGSNLQAPVTGKVKRGSKAWRRRKNFCSRSRSWKGPRGLAARRRWKC
jgi:hypothetical protein